VELNTRTKVCGGVLVVALGVLVFDHFTSGPESADAANPVVADNPTTQVKDPAPTSPSVKGSLASRLNELSKDSAAFGPFQRENVFVAPAAWFPPDPEPAAPAAPTEDKLHASGIRSVFAVTGGAVYAVVDGKVLQPGVPATFEGPDEKVHTYELIRAWTEKGGGALVKIDGREVELLVRKPETDSKENAANR
jgi:hypothetical protein